MSGGVRGQTFKEVEKGRERVEQVVTKRKKKDAEIFSAFSVNYKQFLSLPLCISVSLPGPLCTLMLTHRHNIYCKLFQPTD